MLRAIDNIGICVSDLPRAVAFYQRLGFTKAFENERGSTMVCGDAKLFLFETRQSDPRKPQRGLELFENPPGIDHVSFLVDDVDQAYVELKARGLGFHVQPADQVWGARVAALKDPDGNNLYLLQWIG